jgi:hypothetical protein
MAADVILNFDNDKSDRMADLYFMEATLKIFFIKIGLAVQKLQWNLEI